jgi:hypothetical protein
MSTALSQERILEAIQHTVTLLHLLRVNGVEVIISDDGVRFLVPDEEQGGLA